MHDGLTRQRHVGGCTARSVHIPRPERCKITALNGDDELRRQCAVALARCVVGDAHRSFSASNAVCSQLPAQRLCARQCGTTMQQGALPVQRTAHSWRRALFNSALTVHCADDALCKALHSGLRHLAHSRLRTLASSSPETAGPTQDGRRTARAVN
jgi:hypothetical protein